MGWRILATIGLAAAAISFLVIASKQAGPISDEALTSAGIHTASETKIHEIEGTTKLALEIEPEPELEHSSPDGFLSGASNVNQTSPSRNAHLSTPPSDGPIIDPFADVEGVGDTALRPNGSVPVSMQIPVDPFDDTEEPDQAPQGNGPGIVKDPFGSN